MKSKTKIKNRKVRKSNSEIVETIELCLKHSAWRSVGQIISAGKRNYKSVNLKEIDRQTKAGDTVIVIGSVLGSGELTKKVRVCALKFSEVALSKMKSVKAEHVSIAEEIKKNSKAEGVRVI